MGGNLTGVNPYEIWGCPNIGKGLPLGRFLEARGNQKDANFMLYVSFSVKLT